MDLFLDHVIRWQAAAVGVGGMVVYGSVMSAQF